MTPDKPTELYRLEQSQYLELERAVGQAPFVQTSTTELQAGFMLGVQHVLTKLRSGYVIGA